MSAATKPNEITRDVSPLTRRSTLRSANAEKRTVDIVWSTGAKVMRSSWFDGPHFEELDMAGVKLDRLNNGAPFLADHDGSQVANVLGVFVAGSARVVKGEGIATIRFAAEGVDPNADMIFKKILDGVIANVSVGYRSHTIEKVTKEGEKIPTFVVRSWTPYEASAVAMGADDDAGFRSERSKQTNQCVFVTPQQRSNDMKVKRQQEDGNGGGGGSPNVAQAETERVEGIRHSIRTAKLEASIGDELIRSGVPLAEARKQVLDVLAARSDALGIGSVGGSSITGGETSSEKFIRGASAWLFEKSGNGVVQRAVEAKVKGFTKLELDGGEFRGMSLIDLARESLERQGVRTRGLGRQQLVGMALTHVGMNQRAGTSDFAILYENVMNKTLIGAYATAPDTWSKFCKVETVDDFRAAHRFRVGTFGPLDIVREHAEYKNKPIPDGSKLSISTETKGNIIALSRQAIINDDMGSMADLAARFGRAAKLSIEVDVFALLAENSGLGPTQTDAQPFFHSNRANVATAAALSVAALDADRQVLAAQKDNDDVEFLDLEPFALLVPIGLGSAAKILNTSAWDHDAGHLEKPNAVQGIVKEVVQSPRLTVTSTTRRYLFANPNVAPAIVVAFLAESGQGPYLETAQGWRVDGTEWKVRIDAMAQMHDPKGAVTNAGT